MALWITGLEEVRCLGDPQPLLEMQDLALARADLGRNGDPQLMLMLWERTYPEGSLGTRLHSKCIISLNPYDITL